MSNDSSSHHPDKVRHNPDKTDKSGDKSAGAFGPVPAIIVTVLAFLAPQIAIAFTIGIYLQSSGRDPDEFTRALEASVPGTFILIILTQLTALAVIFWFMRRRKISLSEIGLGRGPKLSDVGFAVLCTIVYFIALAFVMQGVDRTLPSINLDQPQQLPFESVTGLIPLSMVFITLVVLPPIVEEIMIRGFLYSGLRRKLGKIIAALIASLVFGIAHLQLFSGALPLYVAAIDTFVLSLFLIALREKTGSLWSGMVVHGLKNSLAFLSLFVFNLT